MFGFFELIKKRTKKVSQTTVTSLLEEISFESLDKLKYFAALAVSSSV